MTDRTFDLLRDLELTFPLIPRTALLSIFERLATDSECAVALGFDNKSPSRDELELELADIESQRAKIQLAAINAFNEIIDMLYADKPPRIRRKSLGAKAICRLEEIARSLF
jgi:hypothetical protein